MSLDWPPAFERTPAEDREPNRRYEASLSDSLDDLEAELDRLGVDDWRLSTAMDHQRRNPNRPYANQPEPDDPGAVIRWSMDGEQYAIACDAYTRVRDNVRTIGLYIREKRKMEARPVTTGESEFANARLPSADEAIAARRPPHDVLGVDANADEETIRAAARQLKADFHPDGSRPDTDRFKRIVDAEEAMLDG